MSFSLTKIIKKSTKFLAATMIAVVLSGITTHTPVFNNANSKVSNSVVYNGGFIEKTSAIGPAPSTEELAKIDADQKTTIPTTTKDSQAKIDGVDILNSFFAILAFIMTPLIMLAGWLMDPSWTMGDVFNMREMFHSLWVLISNLVYVAFAFILVVMAFKNIFGDAKDAYALKSGLPKLLTGIVMVPFTWFIVSGTLSVANIATAAVLRLPSGIVDSLPGDQNGWLKTIKVPKDIMLNITSPADCTKNPSAEGCPNFVGPPRPKSNEKKLSGADCKNKGADYGTIGVDNEKCITIKTLMTGGGKGIYGVLIPYAYGIFNIQDMQNIDLKEITSGMIKDVGSIFEKGLFGVLFYAAFAIIVIALVAALFMRAVYLWIYIIFSPIFALQYFFGGKMFGDNKQIGQLQISKFISLAFMPVFVAGALGFGMLFLSAAVSLKVSQGDAQFITYDAKNGSMDWKFGEFTFKTKGVFNETTADGTNTVLDMTKSFFGKVIINFLALAILWGAVKAALASNEITKKVTEPIFKFGETLAKSAPIIPGGMSIGSMQAAARIPQTALDNKIQQQLRESGLQGKTDKLFGVDSSALTSKAREIQGKSSNDKAVVTQNARELLTAGTSGTALDFMRNETAVQALQKQLDVMKSEASFKPIIEKLEEAIKNKNPGGFSSELQNLNSEMVIKGGLYAGGILQNHGKEKINGYMYGSAGGITNNYTIGEVKLDSDLTKGGTIKVDLPGHVDQKVSFSGKGDIKDIDKLKGWGELQKEEKEKLQKEIEAAAKKAVEEAAPKPTPPPATPIPPVKP